MRWKVVPFQRTTNLFGVKQEPHRLFPMAFSQRELMYLPFRFQSQLPQFQLSERVEIFFGDTLEPGTPYRNIYEEFGDYKYFMS
ncbi:MAG: hypothetical protein BRC54_10510 [Cyanobacteria bacterium SW_7_48_12]|nr:MAG: hypothetical protein BRC54_10510 [Cyanobacteria bacterium SW_7_48_12]